ncbi:Probable cysteine desulfurase [uncultured Roseburia sp.]|uniref:cysteine desulfurase n=1 Tax=Brotonthovivens ammoniilytica TaxID=2981725 RepID=A0ABT2TN91_9FIRM|nr:aminotransferase class V-fold PLP-dependent enzyme [Brotonthovivens ammoniilytica]MCU6763713.1 aminotransferase class V-fold PLP-dependent enzyme [Brotonthovivens ammoniilytica]SCJ31469.1 Probable cysteine desulfurase [uncultured Roseburia sp.]
MIYLDHAATSMYRPDCVIKAVAEAMYTIGNSGRGVNEGALSAARLIYEARETISDFFQLGYPAGVCFTSNATEALNTAILGLIHKGDHIITTDLEHNSVLRPLYYLEKQGVEISFLKSDKSGCVKEEDIPSLIRKNTKAVICTHASNLTGNLIDIHKVGRIAAEHGLLFILDASQTAGTFPIHMQDDQISVLCFTGHKGIMGPQGTGGLCVSKGILIDPLKMGGTGVQTYAKEQPGEYPVRLEAGTLNGHGIAGLLRAFQYLEETGILKIHEKEYRLMRLFYDGVKNIPGVTVYGNFSGDRAPIVSLNIEGYDSGEVSDILWQEYDIAVRSGAHCAPRMHEALGTKGQGAVRFSFGWFNTEEEIRTAIDAVRSIAKL